MSDVLVVVELREGKPTRTSTEALAAGEVLAAKTGGACAVAVLSSGGNDALGEVQGGRKVYSVEHELLQRYTPDGCVLALEQLLRKAAPSYVVFPHTYQVRDFAPALATRFGRVLISDVTAIHDGPVFVRPLLQGKLNGDYRQVGEGPCFLSVQAGSFAAGQAVAAEQPEAREVFVPELAAEQVRSRPGEPFRETAGTVDLSAAPLIVSVGRGVGQQENLEIVEQLASALGAEMAASRPVCDAGWLPMDRQVGSSGQTVSPRLYVAVGISGAIQHLVGIKGSKTVVAINKDENAPIFEVADFGLVGDLFDIVPALTEAVLAGKASP